MPNSLVAQLDLLTGKTEQQNKPDKNKIQTENLFIPYQHRNLHNLASNRWLSQLGIIPNLEMIVLLSSLKTPKLSVVVQLTS